MSSKRGLGHHNRLIRRTERAERGSALLIALIFMLVFSIILAAITTYAQTNANVNKKLVAQRSQNYVGDGALEGAINWAKDTPNVGRDPVLYPNDPPCVYTKPAVGTRPAITVSCAAPAGSGSGRGPAGGTYPPNAILTLGQRTTLLQTGANGNFPGCGGGPEDGIRSRLYGLPSGASCDTSKATNGKMTIRGDIRSNSTIKLDGSPIETWPKQNGTQTKAYSVLSCNNVTSLTATSPTAGPGCAGTPGTLADPNYTHRPINTTVQTLPTGCTGGPNTVMIIQPGTYSSASALSQLFNNSNCYNHWIWFQPGVYYFNFTNTGNQTLKCGPSAANQYQTAADSNRHEWCIGRTGKENVHVVGGTPYNWDGVTPPVSGKEFPQNIDGDNPFGGNCDPGAPGVQFIFGGDSRLYVADGNVELCAGPDPANPAAPQIAIYGLKGQSISTSVTQVGDTCPQGGRYHCTTNVQNAATIDGTWADQNYKDGCDILPCKTSSAPIRVNFTGYTVPPGNTIQKVTLRVAYNTNAPTFLGVCEVGSLFNQIITIINVADAICSRPQYTVAGPTGSSTCQNKLDFPATTRMTTVAFDITSCFGGSGADISNFHVDWQARGNGVCLPFSNICTDFSDQLDGMQLEVQLTSTTPSAEHPADGCIIDGPNYADGLGEFDCAILKNDQLNADPNAATPAPLEYVGRTSIKGTIYAPSDAVDFSDSFAKYPLFQRGLIARHLRIESYKYIGSKVGTGGGICPVVGTTITPCEPTAHVADIDPNVFVFPRTTTFTECIQAPTGNQNVCDSAEGDTILGTAKVNFSVTPDANQALAGNQPAADRPEVLDWQNRR